MKQYIHFFLQLLLLLAVIIPVLYFIHSFDAHKNSIQVSIYSVSMFTVLSILLFFILNKSVKSPDKQLFISITLMNMLVKMVCSIGLLLFYKFTFQPVNGKFIIPFIVIYLFFTIFETYFMVNLANQKHN